VNIEHCSQSFNLFKLHNVLLLHELLHPITKLDEIGYFLEHYIKCYQEVNASNSYQCQNCYKMINNSIFNLHSAQCGNCTLNDKIKAESFMYERKIYNFIMANKKPIKSLRIEGTAIVDNVNNDVNNDCSCDNCKKIFISKECLLLHFLSSNCFKTNKKHHSIKLR
jgi:hypothetical protein